MYNRLLKKRLTAIIFLIPLFTLLSYSQGRPDDERLLNLVRLNRQAEVSIPYPGRAEIETLTRNVSIRSVREKTVFILLSPLTVEWFISRRFDYTIIEKEAARGIISSGSTGRAMEWDTYPSYTQYDSIMRYLASGYPSLCRLDTIGTSIMGKLVMALKISDNCRQDEIEPEVFLTSTMHGDETGGFVLMLRFADYLLKNYGTDTEVNDLVDNLEIWINPLANPDGTYNNGNVMNSPVRNNANNIDLNRNFPDPEAPNSVRQKETLDMMRFLAKHRFVISANFHSGEEVVNYPWDRWKRDHPDKAWFYSISRSYADTAHMHSPFGYMNYLDNGVTNGYYWYQVNGSRQDYVTYELQGREVTIEIDFDYVTPANRLNGLWEYNRRSLLGYLENAVKGISGQVRDAVSGDPVPAMIFINGHDLDNSQVYSDTLTGEFVRLLEPGVWDLNFSANGYKSTTLNGIELSSTGVSGLIVEMERALNPIDTTKPLKPLLYPDPGITFMKAVLPEDLMGPINVSIFNLTGRKMSGFNTVSLFGDPVIMDLGGLADGIYFVVFRNIESGLTYKSSFIVKR